MVGHEESRSRNYVLLRPLALAAVLRFPPDDPGSVRLMRATRSEPLGRVDATLAGIEDSDHRSYR